MKKWKVEDIKSQNGKNIVITGGTSGIGYETARSLAKVDANVYIAARNENKARECINKIKDEYSMAKVEFLKLDTSSLESINDFAKSFKEKNVLIDVLILNAGIFNVPTLQRTKDNFELQLATNYLGHFALTGLLLPYIRNSKESRIIGLSSLSHTWTTLDLHDFNLFNSYKPLKAYAQSKLAVLIYIKELNKRLKENNYEIEALVAHPGICKTSLARHDKKPTFSQRIMKLGFNFIGQKPQMGALPILFAATSESAEGGNYYGPHFMGESRGYPVVAKMGKNTKKVDSCKLWDLSVELTGIKYLCNE